MAKLNKKVLQFGCYLERLNWLRSVLVRDKVSQADFSKYLCMDEKQLSLILNGQTVPNAALFEYMCYIFTDISAYGVFLRWLYKFGTSSTFRYRVRCFEPISVPQDYD